MSDAQAGEMLVKRLGLVSALTEDARRALLALPFEIQEVRSDTDIVREGERLDRCCLIVEGFTYRYRNTVDGKRQIMAFHVPGDIPDLHSLHVPLMDHGFSTTVTSKVAFVPHRDVWGLCLAHPDAAAVLWRETLIDSAVFREWMVGLGRRSALVRTAHLLCELAMRLRSIGLGPNNVYNLPLTQAQLADALGLTVVSVNHVLKELTRKQLIERDRARFVVRDWEGLAAVGDFDPLYLHYVKPVDMA